MSVVSSKVDFFVMFFVSRFYFYRKSEVVNNFLSFDPFSVFVVWLERPEHVGSDSVIFSKFRCVLKKL